MPVTFRMNSEEKTLVIIYNEPNFNENTLKTLYGQHHYQPPETYLPKYAGEVAKTYEIPSVSIVFFCNKRIGQSYNDPTLAQVFKALNEAGIELDNQGVTCLQDLTKYPEQLERQAQEMGMTLQEFKQIKFDEEPDRISPLLPGLEAYLVEYQAAHQDTLGSAVALKSPVAAPIDHTQASLQKISAVSPATHTTPQTTAAVSLVQLTVNDGSAAKPSFFSPSTAFTKVTLFEKMSEQLRTDIIAYRETLQRQVNARFKHIGHEKKLEKIKVLNRLLELDGTMELGDAVKTVKSEYQHTKHIALDGNTLHLLNLVEGEASLLTSVKKP